MNRSILNVTILVLLILGCAVSASDFANTAVYLTDDPNAPTPESIICLTEDTNDGSEGAGEGDNSGDAE